MKQTILLGELIEHFKACNRDAEVRFDFCFLTPSGLDSYRGYYDHLAIGWTADCQTWNVANMIELLESAIGSTYTGWKGGEYTMDQLTPVWADNPGQASSTAITGVDNRGYRVIIKTESTCVDSSSYDGIMKILSEARSAELLEYAASPQEHLYITCNRCSNSYLSGKGGHADCPRCTEQLPSLHELQHDPDTWPGHKFFWNQRRWEPVDQLNQYVLCDRDTFREIVNEIGYNQRYQGMWYEAAALQELRRRGELLKIARISWWWCKRTGLRFDLLLKELNEQCPGWKDALGHEWLESTRCRLASTEIEQKTLHDSELTADPDRVASSHLHAGVLVRARIAGS